MKYSFFLIFCIYLNASAQVGIGTTSPKSIFDITASNISSPANDDGILIPRIDAFPAVNPTAAQNSMLVYLTTNVGVFTKGFHYWDNSLTKWVPFSGNSEWEDTAAPVDGIIASQAKTAGNKVIITDTGRLGLGTDAPTDVITIEGLASSIIRMRSTGSSVTPAGALIIEEDDPDWNGTLQFNTDPNAWQFLASGQFGEHMLMFIDAENENEGFVRIGKMDVDTVSGSDVKEVLEVLGSIKIGASPSVTNSPIVHDDDDNVAGGNPGSTTIPDGGAGTIVFQDGHFFGYNGSVWKQLDN